MMTLEQIKSDLKDRNLKLVADKAGIHYGTLYRVMRGEGETTYRVVKALSDYLENRRPAA